VPICSYLVYPDSGKSREVHRQLSTLPGCSVFPAIDHELLMLVTDTPTDEAERSLQEKLKSQPHIQCLAMSFAHSEEEVSS
jgi:nitrate reductase NapAB chaperone NapD